MSPLRFPSLHKRLQCRVHVFARYRNTATCDPKLLQAFDQLFPTVVTKLGVSLFTHEDSDTGGIHF